MPLLAVAVSILLAQSPPAQPPADAPSCLAPADEGMSAFCAGENFLRQSSGARDAAERQAIMRRAAESFRRSASAAKGFDVKKLALARLESVYDADHLDQPGEIEPILRELIAASPGDNAPMFKLARLQEQQEFFDAAESTLMGAHQQRPDDPEPARELAKFFSRRAEALSGKGNLSTTKTHIDPDAPDEKGIYSAGGAIEPPERTSSGTVDIPSEARAAGITGTVMCEIVIDEKGLVTDAKVTQSVPMLDEAALAAVRTWRFTPSILNGRAVPVRLIVQVNFP